MYEEEKKLKRRVPDKDWLSRLATAAQTGILTPLSPDVVIPDKLTPEQRKEMELRIRFNGLEQELRADLIAFSKEMYQVMFDNLLLKGVTWKTEKDGKFLINRLMRAVELCNWVDVANYAFMLNNLAEILKK